MEDIRRMRLDLDFLRGSGGDAAGIDAAALDREEGHISADPEFLQLLNALASDPETPGITKRRADVLARDALAASVRTDPKIARLVQSLEDRFRAFHPWLDGQPSRFADVEAVLRTERDRDRREAAWFAAAPLGEELEGGVASLFALRNRAAGTHGFNSFAELAFEAAGIDRLDYMTLCDEIEQLTRSRFEEMLARLRDYFDGATLEPWDLDFGFGALGGPVESIPRSAFPDRLARTVAGWGIDAGALPITTHDADLSDGPVCLPVDPASDIRILGDFRDGPASCDAFLRVHGTALHHHLGSSQDGVFARDRSPLPAATGELVVRLAGGPEAEMATAARLYRLRRWIARSLFEILAHEKPDGDLHSLHCEIAEHYMGFPRHPERLWTADGAIVTRPLFSVHRVLAEVTAASFQAALAARFGDAQSTGAGEALKATVWMPADSIPWMERVRALTGRPLDPDALLSELGADSLDG